MIGDRRAVSSGELRLRAIDLAIALSIVAHALALWLSQVSWMPRPLPPTPDAEGKGAAQGRLEARIAPPPVARAPDAPQAPAAPPAARSAPVQKSRSAPAAKARPPASPPAARPAPVITGAGPPRPAPPEIAKAESAPPRPAPGSAAPMDMDAMLRARREARGEAPPAAAPAAPAAPGGARSESEADRRERAVMANLGSLRAPSPGESRARGGGVFQVRSRGVEEAEFLFFGWNKDMLRNNTQSITVRKGNNPSIELAVVRRMIGIIREHEQGDFDWYSPRQGRHFTLSARQRDNAELEAFLMRDFF